MSDDPAVVGIVPVEGRGALRFAVLHGEPLAARASRTLREAGVEVLDLARWRAGVVSRGAALVVHDPLCPATPAEFLRAAVATAAGVVVVGVHPVTDTVRMVDGRGLLGRALDRAALLTVASPVVIPARVLVSVPGQPPVDDLADLVVRLRSRHPPVEVVFLPAPAAARRVTDESDLRLLEALTDPTTDRSDHHEPPPG